MDKKQQLYNHQRISKRNAALPDPPCEEGKFRIPRAALSIFLLLLLPGLLPAQSFLEQAKLQDTLGYNIQPGTVSGKTMSAVVFLGTDCPISRQYTRTLSDLSQRYPQVRFVGLFTKWAKLKDMRQFCRNYQLPFEIYKDHKHRLARKLEATVMPEVFLLAPNGEILYSGAIDNWFFALGKHRQEATEHYLEAAIQATLQHQSAPIKRTEPVGCVLEY